MPQILGHFKRQKKIALALHDANIFPQVHEGAVQASFKARYLSVLAANELTVAFVMFQRTGPPDLYGKMPRGPSLGRGMDELDDFSDEETTPLTEPIYNGR